MRFVDIVDGAFEVRWTWLPFWMATNPDVTKSLEKDLKTIVALNGLTDSDDDMDALNRLVVSKIEKMFPMFPGIKDFLLGLNRVSMC